MRARALTVVVFCLTVIACERDGTNRADGPLPRVLDSFSVGSDAYVRSLAIDETTRSLWVGTSVGALEVGLDDRRQRRAFTRRDGLANEYVFATFVDSRGDVWFGTNAGGVSRFGNETWRVFFPMHGLADYWVYSFAEQDAGTLWIGTWAGANRVNLETLRFETFVDELVNEWVYGIDVDSHNRVWFGTEGGVSMFDGDAWHSWTHADGLGAPNIQNRPSAVNTGLGTRSRHDLSVLREGEETYNPSYVFAVAVDEYDRVWAGTWGGGVSVLEDGRWTNRTIADGLAGNIVYSIAIDAQGVYWFGTDRGLTRYDGESWATYDRSVGLMGDHVYALVASATGDLYAGTKGAVTRIGQGE